MVYSKCKVNSPINFCFIVLYSIFWKKCDNPSFKYYIQTFLYVISLIISLSSWTASCSCLKVLLNWFCGTLCSADYVILTLCVFCNFFYTMWNGVISMQCWYIPSFLKSLFLLLFVSESQAIKKQLRRGRDCFR